jgi:hypothetical protein
MKYYKIQITTLYDNNQRFRSEADGKYVPNANSYFYRMRGGEILKDAPIFDYFILRNYDESRFPDTEFLDVHSFIGEGSQILGWFVSADLKLLLENFQIAQPHYFYPSKLLYKGNKLDYYIFQYIGVNTTDRMIEKYINLSASIFYSPEEQRNIFVNSVNEFTEEYKRIITAFRLRNKLEIKKIVLHESLDFFPMETYLNDNIVSSRLKQAIETMGITGFEFSELDYEVVIEG